MDDWRGLYKKGWNGNLVPEAFSHPAKVSFGLAERIYQHMSDEGWIHPGDVVLDPFGGIAGFGFHAMRYGCNFIGVELEPRFVTLGNQNIEMWCKKFGTMPGWGTARLVQGDSRRLLEVVGEAGAVVSSPPYAESIETSERGSGIDYSKAMNSGKGRTPGREAIATGYGTTEGNLGNMPARGFEAAVSSPPYAETPIAAYDGSMGETWRETGKTPRQRSGGKLENEQYGGSTPGQLGAMPARGYEQAIKPKSVRSAQKGTPS